MTATTFWVVAVAALLVSGLAATAVKVLQEFSRRELQQYCRRRNRLDLFREILDDYERVMTGAEALQVVSTVVLVWAAALWLYRWLGTVQQMGLLQFTAGLAAAALLVLALTAWIPRAVVNHLAAPFLYHLWRMLKWITRPLWPLTLGGSVFDALLRRLAGRPESEEDEEEAFEDEIRSIVTEGVHDGMIEEEALGMIEGVIELGDTDVLDIMTPRSNVDALDINLPWREVLRFVVDVGRTRIPVYEENLDNIIGVLYVKDLLQELSRGAGQPRRPLRSLLRKPWFVPATKPLDELLGEFKDTRRHLAIVVDEYHRVSGVVTIEDVLEEIVGEIVDESDKEEEQDIEELNENFAIVRGTAHLHSVNEKLGLELPEPDECDTLGGLLMSQLGRIPKSGDSLSLDSARLTVIDATRRRVDRLQIEMLRGANGESSAKEPQ